MEFILKLLKATLFLSVFISLSYAKDFSPKIYQAEEFLSDPVISSPTLSPNGEVVAYRRSNSIYVGNRGRYQKLLTIQNDYDIIRYRWTGDESITLKLYKKSNGYIYFENYHFNKMSDKYIVDKKSIIKRNGYIIDSVPEDSYAIIFGSYYSDDDKSLTEVYYVNMRNKISSQFRKKFRRDKWNRNIQYWLTDSQHKLTLGISYEKGKPTVWRKRPRKRGWEIKWQAKSKGFFFPVKLADNLDKFWAVTNLNSDKKVAIEFDLINYKISKKLYKELDSDIYNIQFNARNEPISISYQNKGIFKYKYFSKNTEIKALLPENLKHKQNIINDENFSAHSLIVSVFSDTSPGSVYYCRGEPYDCNKIQDFYPWLKDYKMAVTHGHRITSDSNGKKLEIDIFVTLPGSSLVKRDHFPLIIMPHGGPIGVADDSSFSGEIQWLAYHGYAVLKVNYRGSGGYGKNFEKAGMKEWGRGIEDDIENALKFTLKTYPQIDKHRLAIFGSSYGGYSALMSVIRGKVDYKCAASFAGVTDLPLMFAKASMKNNDDISRQLAEIVGDPVKNKQNLIAYSPVYQYKKINKPVFLAHGTKDPIVDIEHSYRMSAMLDLAGKPHELYIMDNIGHGFSLVTEQKKFYKELLEFLDKYL